MYDKFYYIFPSKFNCTRSHSLQYKALMYSIGMIFLTLSWIITQGWIFLELFSFIYTKWYKHQKYNKSSKKTPFLVRHFS